MKKNFFSRRIAIISSITAAFVIGISGGSAVAAGSYQAYTPKSYGTFTFDDGDASNNNDHEHDFMIDTSDLIKLSDNVDSLANTTDEINNNLGGNRLIYNESEDAFYIQHGADAALKKLGDADWTLLLNFKVGMTGYEGENRLNYSQTWDFTIKCMNGKISTYANISYGDDSIIKEGHYFIDTVSFNVVSFTIN